MFWALPVLVGVCGRSVVELGRPYRYRYIQYNSADSEAPEKRSQSNLTQFCCSKTCLALGSWGSQTTHSLQVQKSPAMAAMGHQACLVGSSARARSNEVEVHGDWDPTTKVRVSKFRLYPAMVHIRCARSERQISISADTVYSLPYTHRRVERWNPHLCRATLLKLLCLATLSFPTAL